MPMVGVNSVGRRAASSFPDSGHRRRPTGASEADPDSDDRAADKKAIFFKREACRFAPDVLGGKAKLNLPNAAGCREPIRRITLRFRAALLPMTEAARTESCFGG